MQRLTLSERTVAAGRETLAGRRRGLRGFLPFAGPAIIASIAYMDPGNFATNIQAGAKYNYSLLWVVLVANLVAMLFQALSAKLGIVTDTSLAEACRDRFPRPVVWAMWVVSEIAAMATDLAEFLGGALGLSLLTGVALFPCLVATGVVTYALLSLGDRGFRPIELVIGGFVGAIGLAYVAELFVAPPDWGGFLHGAVTPALPDADGDHAVGRHHRRHRHAARALSALQPDAATACRRASPAERRAVLRFSNIEVVVALGLAGLVNMAMVAMAAAAFHQGHAEVAEIEAAYHTLVPLLGGGAALVFALSLLASGFSSSMVGTMAGPDDHAGFRPFPHSALAAPRGDDGAGLRAGGDRRQRHAVAGLEPGGAEPGLAGADAGAGGADRRPAGDGRLRQRTAHPGGGDAGGGGGAGAERAAGGCRRSGLPSRGWIRARRRRPRGHATPAPRRQAAGRQGAGAGRKPVGSAPRGSSAGRRCGGCGRR